MKSISAKCGHVTRQLNKKEPLSGKPLKFALSLIEDKNDELFNRITSKLESRQILDDYESHIMREIVLLSEKMSAKSI